MHRIVSTFQAIYYMVTGIWPVLHMESFMTFTGPKFDLWLVETVGLLAASVGAGTGYAVVTGQFGRPLLLVLILSAGAFMFIDVWYSLTKVISYVYLADAFCQVIFIVSHALHFRRSDHPSPA